MGIKRGGGGGGIESLGQKLHFLRLNFLLENWGFVGEIFQNADQQLKICLHDSKISSFLSIKMLSVSFISGGKRFLAKLKNRHFLTHFFLTSTPI